MLFPSGFKVQAGRCVCNPRRRPPPGRKGLVSGDKPGTDHGIHGTMVRQMCGHFGTRAATVETTPWAAVQPEPSAVGPVTG